MYFRADCLISSWHFTPCEHPDLNLQTCSFPIVKVWSKWLYTFAGADHEAALLRSHWPHKIGSVNLHVAVKGQHPLCGCVNFFLFFSFQTPWSPTVRQHKMKTLDILALLNKNEMFFFFVFFSVKYLILGSLAVTLYFYFDNLRVCAVDVFCLRKLFYMLSCSKNIFSFLIMSISAARYWQPEKLDLSLPMKHLKTPNFITTHETKNMICISVSLSSRSLIVQLCNGSVSKQTAGC